MARCKCCTAEKPVSDKAEHKRPVSKPIRGAYFVQALQSIAAGGAYAPSPFFKYLRKDRIRRGGGSKSAQMSKNRIPIERKIHPITEPMWLFFRKAVQ